MSKKKDSVEIVEMKCPVCSSCYREVRPGFSPDRCHFGGPFSGYKSIWGHKIT